MREVWEFPALPEAASDEAMSADTLEDAKVLVLARCPPLPDGFTWLSVSAQGGARTFYWLSILKYPHVVGDVPCELMESIAGLYGGLLVSNDSVGEFRSRGLCLVASATLTGLDYGDAERQRIRRGYRPRRAYAHAYDRYCIMTPVSDAERAEFLKKYERSQRGVATSAKTFSANQVDISDSHVNAWCSGLAGEIKSRLLHAAGLYSSLWFFDVRANDGRLEDSVQHLMALLDIRGAQLNPKNKTAGYRRLNEYSLIMDELAPHLHKKPLKKWQRTLLEWARKEVPFWKRMKKLQAKKSKAT